MLLWRTILRQWRVPSSWPGLKSSRLWRLWCATMTPPMIQFCRSGPNHRLPEPECHRGAGGQTRRDTTVPHRAGGSTCLGGRASTENGCHLSDRAEPLHWFCSEASGWRQRRAGAQRGTGKQLSHFSAASELAPNEADKQDYGAGSHDEHFSAGKFGVE